MKLKKKLKYNFFFLLTILFIFFSPVKAQDVKIVAKIENNIITNIDVDKEFDYLVTLNTSLKNIDKTKVFEFAKNSLIKENIKKIEIMKFYELGNKNETVDKLIENIYRKLNFTSIDLFKDYLEINNLKFNDVYKKLEIEAVWNEMIYQLFKEKIYVNEEELKSKILNNKKKMESFLLSEIVINIKNKNEIDLKYNELVNHISKFGFNESVLKFSESNTKNNSGLLGWVNNNSLSKKIQNEINKIDIGQITKPILISSGMLVLKLEDKKIVELNQNLEEELEKLASFEINNQLNNFSTIHYNKIKKNFLVNE